MGISKRGASKAKGARKAAPEAPNPEASLDPAAVARAVDLIAGVMALKGNQRIIPEIIREGRKGGIVRAVRAHDTPFLYDWFMDLLSLQGISDRNALGYIERWGNATYADVGRRLATTRCACPKLKDFASFTGCGYRKDARTCANPQHLRLCPVRQLPLRNGLLNIQAVSLHRWLTDVCGGDLVAWIDSAIAAAKAAGDEGAATLNETLPSLPVGVLELDTATQAAMQLEPRPTVQDEGLEGCPGEGEPEGCAGVGRAAEAQSAVGPLVEAGRAGVGQPGGVMPSEGSSAASGPTAALAAVPAKGKGNRPAHPAELPALVSAAQWVWQAKASLVASLSAVEGVSAKLANMTIAALMIGGRPNDADWLAVASLTVTVDSLIHNMLARTGVLAAFGAEHAYGPRCYSPTGCEAVIYKVTEAIRAGEMAAGPGIEPPDLRASGPPQLTCIEVQKALWRFCTMGVLDYCNAARVGPGPGCRAAHCPVRPLCRQSNEGKPSSEPNGAQG